MNAGFGVLCDQITMGYYVMLFHFFVHFLRVYLHVLLCFIRCCLFCSQLPSRMYIGVVSTLQVAQVLFGISNRRTIPLIIPSNNIRGLVCVRDGAREGLVMLRSIEVKMAIHRGTDRQFFLRRQVVVALQLRGEEHCFGAGADVCSVVLGHLDDDVNFSTTGRYSTDKALPQDRLFVGF